MRLALAGVAAAMVLTGCSGIQEAAEEGAVEGALSVLGQLAIEQAAGVKLAGELDCAAKASGDDHEVDCSGETPDGKKASVKGSVTSFDAAQGVVRGKLTLVFDGKELGEQECVGAC